MKFTFNPGDCIVVCDGMGKQINILHQVCQYGYLQNTPKLTDVLEVGYSQDIEETEMQALRDNVQNNGSVDWNTFFSKLLIEQQEVYYLACWLDNRKKASC